MNPQFNDPSFYYTLTLSNKMFARISSLFMFLLFAFPLLAAASVVPRTTTPPVSQCNTGSIQCCNSTQESSALTSPVLGLLGLLGVVVGSLTAQVGLTCSPLSIIGLGSNACTAQPVCCTGNNFSGLIVLGCSPINIGL